MSEITTLPSASVIRTNPELMKPTVYTLQNFIATAAALKKWEEVGQAVDALIERQQVFLGWWTEHVSIRHGLNRHSLESAGRGTLPLAVAERDTGISNQLVSRWRRLLKDTAAYREDQIAGARQRAELESSIRDASMARGQPTRDGPDFWPTPPCLTAAAMRYVLPGLPLGEIWECAAGSGGLGRAIAEAGRTVISTDLYPQDGSMPHDFRSGSLPDGAAGSIAMTNPPNNQWNEFLDQGLALLDQGLLKGLVLLLRHDYLQAGGRVDALNRAVREVHCNWRPIWIPDTDGNPRHAFHWLAWHDGPRQPPLYLTEAAVE